MLHQGRVLRCGHQIARAAGPPFCPKGRMSDAPGARANPVIPPSEDAVRSRPELC